MEKFEADKPSSFWKIILIFCKEYVLVHLLSFLPPSNFAVHSFQPIAAISFVNAYKRLKTPQIDQINYLFQLWRLLWVKSYANEQKCKHWRQERFALKKFMRNEWTNK